MNTPQITVPSPNTEMIKILAPIALVVIVYFVGKKFFGSISDAVKTPFESLNIIDTKEEKKEKKSAEKKAKEIGMSVNSPLNPNYYKNKIGARILTVAVAEKLANEIYSAIGVVYDSPEQIVSAIKKCVTKSQISFLAEIFSKKYNKDLYEFLDEKLDTTSQKIIFGRIVDYINNLKVK